jgi:hypothetical protein
LTRARAGEYCHPELCVAALRRALASLNRNALRICDEEEKGIRPGNIKIGRSLVVSWVGNGWAALQKEWRAARVRGAHVPALPGDLDEGRAVDLIWQHLVAVSAATATAASAEGVTAEALEDPSLVAAAKPCAVHTGPDSAPAAVRSGEADWPDPARTPPATLPEVMSVLDWLLAKAGLEVHEMPSLAGGGGEACGGGATRAAEADRRQQLEEWAQRLDRLCAAVRGIPRAAAAERLARAARLARRQAAEDPALCAWSTYGLAQNVVKPPQILSVLGGGGGGISGGGSGGGEGGGGEGGGGAEGGGEEAGCPAGLGRAVEVLFDDGRWYRGAVRAVRRATRARWELDVLFDDGDEDTVRFPDPEVRLAGRGAGGGGAGRRRPAADEEGAAGGAAGGGAGAGRRAQDAAPQCGGRGRASGRGDGGARGVRLRWKPVVDDPDGDLAPWTEVPIFLRRE